MSGSGFGGNPISGYAVIKNRDPKLGDTMDVKAEQAALDEEDLQELEAELYGEGAGPRPATVDAHEEHGHHLPHPHLPGRG